MKLDRENLDKSQNLDEPIRTSHHLDITEQKYLRADR